MAMNILETWGLGISMATCFSSTRQSKHSPGCVCAPAVYRHLRAELRDSSGAARRSRLCLPPPAFYSNKPWDNDMQKSSAPAMLILHIREALQRGCMWAEPYGRWQLLPGWHSGAAATPDASHSLTLCSSTEFPAEFEVLSPSHIPGGRIRQRHSAGSYSGEATLLWRLGSARVCSGLIPAGIAQG